MTTPKLTDTQLVLLSSAAQRDDHLVVLPEKLKGGAAKATVTKLLSLALTEELTVKADEPHWRRDESDHPIGLKLTRGGLLALGIEPDYETGGNRERETETPTASAQPPRKPEQSCDGSTPVSAWSPREGTKQALVLSLLSRTEGATIDDLLSATGWLPHTTRAALTGLRQKGFEFIKSKNEVGKTVYRTAAPADEAGELVPSQANAGEGPSDANAAAGEGAAA